MLAITSLLDAKHADLVSTIIQDFQKEFGLKQVQATPLPHITYLIAQTYNIDLLKDYLLRLCHTARPVHAYTTGIGVFPGEHPVIYIPVLRTQPLNKMHSHLYQDISNAAVGVGSGLGGGQNRTCTDNFQVGAADPEPSSILLLGGGIGGLLLRRRRC